MKKYYKIIIIALLLLISLFSIYYFHYVIKLELFFSHFFYVPIVVASIFWKKEGIYVAVFLSFALEISQLYSGLGFKLLDLTRPLMFLAVSIVVTILSNKNKNYEIKLAKSKEFSDLYGKLKKSYDHLLKVNEEINEEEQKLVVKNSTKDSLMRVLAHDLRSPYNGLLGFTNLLIENYSKYNQAEIKKYLTIINDTTKNSFNLLEEILLWYRTQSDNFEITIEKINLNEITHEIVSEKKYQADQKNIEIKIDFPNELFLNTDKMIIQTIMRNLLSNAIKFTSKNGSISIFAQKIDYLAFIYVKDSGIGINSDNLCKIWDSNKTFTTKGTENEIGTGLGLKICKEMCNKIGGNITVESELGKGSTFIFSAPLYV